MAIRGWIVDKSAAARSPEPQVRAQLAGVMGTVFLCPMGELEQLYSARSASEYDELKSQLRGRFDLVPAPADVMDRVLDLQRDLAHHHGMWHRTPISDLLIAETALYHDLGVIHIDSDFERIAEVRPLIVRRLRV